MRPWPPEPEFMKFLDAMEKRAGDALPKRVWVSIMEIRAGSDLGKTLYDQFMDDDYFRVIYEAWKALE